MTKKEAIKELNTFKIGAKSELGENALDMAIEALEQEPKTGNWIKKGNTLSCPICGAVGEDIKSDYCFNYCPNYGAKMESEV